MRKAKVVISMLLLLILSFTLSSTIKDVEASSISGSKNLLTNDWKLGHSTGSWSYTGTVDVASDGTVNIETSQDRGIMARQRVYLESGKTYRANFYFFSNDGVNLGDFIVYEDGTRDEIARLRDELGTSTFTLEGPSRWVEVGLYKGADFKTGMYKHVQLYEVDPNDPNLMHQNNWIEGLSVLKTATPSDHFRNVSVLGKYSNGIKITSNPANRGAMVSQRVYLEAGKEYRFTFDFTGVGQDNGEVYIYEDKVGYQHQHITAFKTPAGHSRSFTISGKDRWVEIGFYKTVAAESATYRNISLSETIDMPDANLRTGIHERLGNGSYANPVSKYEIKRVNTLASTYTANRNIKTIKGLEYAENLTLLNLNNNSISDITPVKGLTKLTNLSFAENNVSDISALSKLTNLEYLSFQINNVKSLSSLANLKKLYHLNANTNNIDSISPLSGLNNMEILLIRRNNITDISPISGMNQLIELDLARNNISNISTIKGLNTLVSLNVNNNLISDISAIKDLKNLTFLDLGANKLDDGDMKNLSNSPNLDVLSLAYNSVSDVSEIAKYKQLKTLNVRENHISDLSPISGLSLKTLTANGQTIELSEDNIIGEGTAIKIHPTTNVSFTFDNGTGRYSGGKIIWDSVKNGTGVYTVQWKSSNGNFDGVITQRVVEYLGDVNIGSIEIVGDQYFGNPSTKFFEGNPIRLRYTIEFDTKLNNVHSGPVDVKINIGGKEQIISHSDLDLVSNTSSVKMDTNGNIASKYTKQYAIEVSGKDFKEVSQNISIEVIPKKTGVEKGTNAKRNTTYTSVNKVYDAAIEIMEVHPENPIPGESAKATLKICNNGNQDSGSFVDVFYNGAFAGGGVFNLNAGPYANIGVTSKCDTIVVDTQVPNLIDSNVSYEMEAAINIGPIDNELSASNNKDNKMIEQGVGAEPIYICDTNGDWLETIYDLKDKKTNGSPDNCESEDGTVDPGPDLTDPSEEQVSIVEPKPEYTYPKQPVNTGVPIAKSISGKDFKEEPETIFVEVNPDNKHPDDDINTNNDTRKKQYKSVNKVYDIRIHKVEKMVPAVPNSNEAVKVYAQVCNDGNQNILDYSAQVLYENQNRNSGTVNGLDIERGPYTNIKTDPNCEQIIINTTMFDVENMEDAFDSWLKLYPTLPSGEADNKPANNTLKFQTKVENPNAFIFIRNTGGGDASIISETGGVSLVVQNNMFRNISDNCGSDCKYSSGDANSKAFIKITDKTNNKNLTVPVLTYDLTHTGKQVVRLDKIIKDYIDGLDSKDYQVVEFEIEAQIPHYKGEVDYSGNPSYADNSIKTTVHYFPPRPNVSLMECSVLENPNGSYFQVNGGGPDGPVKSCAGHYPNNPSTQIEEGMQAYHFLMYRFLPTPIPKYEITSPAGSDETDPAFFNQIFDVEEKITEKGDEDSMFFFNKDANGIYQERGRYLPTGASFDFKVEESRENGDVIAAGKITYNIPPNCYPEKSLMLKNQYGCDEIMLFVPNADDDRKFDTPTDFNTEDNKVIYPLGEDGKATTKIPYLNPGIFKFSVDVKENYSYYYQENKAVENDYYWSDIQKK